MRSVLVIGPINFLQLNARSRYYVQKTSILNRSYAEFNKDCNENGTLRWTSIFHSDSCTFSLKLSMKLCTKPQRKSFK